MRSTILFAASTLAACVLAAPKKPTTESPPIPTGYMMGFKNPTTQSSVGGHALCISGIVDVTASAENFKINYEGPANQSALTDFLVQAFQVNSTSAEQLIVGKNIVNGT